MPKLGILQLCTTFSRPPGDVGHPDTWKDIPVVIRSVPGANASTVVGGSWTQELVRAFVEEGHRMMAEDDVVAFVTSCGFLATMHPQLAQELPFIGTSSLIQVAWLQQTFGHGQVGVVTFKASALKADHFKAVGAQEDTPFVGLPESEDGAFRAVLEERRPYDFKAMEKEVVAAALRLVTEHPGVKAIVLECTNMPPFTAAVRIATGRNVWDIVTLGRWLYAGAAPISYLS